MKKSLPLVFIILASTSVSTAFAADDNWYLGALYNAQEISMNGRDFNTAGIITGYQYNEYFALEARLSTGTSGYSTTYGAPQSSEGDYKEDIDTQGSLLIKASYPIFESLSFYGLAGYTKTKLEINGVGSTNDSNGNIIGNYSFKHTESDSGFSYGVGLNYQINEKFNIFVDYQVLPDFEPQPNFSKSWKSTSIGVNYSF
jgi:opacity protein-like surface antigen